MRKVTLADIPELRAYNADRDKLRRSIIALKARRRVHLDSIVTMVFENTATVTWQICEMMRAERLATEQAIVTEIDIYNDLIPEPGELSCTMFLELTEDAAMREWLPKLVGIHDAIAFRLGDGSIVRGVDPNAERLTRSEITSAVHFLKFAFTAEQVDTFRTAPVFIESDHHAYRVSTQLNNDTHEALICDFS
jgi:Protein of unknown function (DUF3501)